MVYAGGDTIEGATTKKLANFVALGEKVDIVYSFKAPTKAGTYQTYFNLLDDQGNFIGQFWVNFKVKSTSPTSTPTPVFAVTSVTFSSSDPTITGAFPQTFDYSAAITTNRAGTVTYHWVFSDGTTSTPQSLSFSGAGTKTVSGLWQLNATGSYWVKLYIDEPNHQLFCQLNLSLTCTPAFAVTSATLSTEEATFTDGCPHTFDNTAGISTNGAGTVTYYLIFSDGTTSAMQTLAFSSAGTQNVDYPWELSTNGSYWIMLQVDSPNHIFSTKLDLNLTCTP